jgi:hypothetical protein
MVNFDAHTTQHARFPTLFELSKAFVCLSLMHITWRKWSKNILYFSARSNSLPRLMRMTPVPGRLEEFENKEPQPGTAIATQVNNVDPTFDKENLSSSQG